MSNPSIHRSEEWLSPSRAWQLLSCPASVRLPRDSGPAREERPNAGALAHRAVQRWIESHQWGQGDVGAQLARCFEEEVASADLEITSLESGVLTRARLKARADQIRDALDLKRVSARTVVRCELGLEDERLRLRGVLDLAVTGDSDIVIDLKTGRDVSREGLPDRIVFQLQIYAHLFAVAYGRLPRRLEVFSLARGRIAIDVSAGTVEAALDMVVQARGVDRSDARPALDVCTYCHRRMECGPHWSAVETGLLPDAIQGEVLRIEEASSGAMAVLVRGDLSEAWITGVRQANDAVRPGDAVRIVRVRCSRPAADGKPALWRAGRTTEICSA